MSGLYTFGISTHTYMHTKTATVNTHTHASRAKLNGDIEVYGGKREDKREADCEIESII